MIVEPLRFYLETKLSPISVYGSFLPPSPDTAIAVFDYPGLPSDPKHTYDYPSFQISTRGYNYLDTMAIAYRVQDELHGLRYATLSGINNISVYFVDIRANQSPYVLSRDEKTRHIFVQNYYSEIFLQTKNRV